MADLGIYLANDGLPASSLANPQCGTCRGMGVVDTGENYGCILVPCEVCVDVDQVDEAELGNPVG